MMRVYGIKEGSIKTWEEERKRGKIEEFCFIFWVEKMIKKWKNQKWGEIV